MENAYDTRVVTYEHITSFPEDTFEKMVEIVRPQEGQHILDVGAGYGPVTQAILKRFPQVKIHYYLLEKSPVQLGRAIEAISKLRGEGTHDGYFHFLNHPMDQSTLPESSLDTIIGKMIIHEMPEEKQLPAVQEMCRILKPGGTFYLWQTILDDETVTFFRNLMRKKDELAGFYSMVQDRHFVTEETFYFLFEQAGFTAWKKEQEFDYHLNSRNRLASEFKNDESKLEEWHAYIQGMIEERGEAFARRIQFSINDGNLSLSLKQGIFSASK